MSPSKSTADSTSVEQTSDDEEAEAPSTTTRVGQEVSEDSATEIAETITRAGWLAKGFIFVVIGLLGSNIARQGYSADDADQSGALSAIADGPAGRVLVLLVGVGLLLFAVWQFWLALTRSADDLLGAAKRLGWAGLGVVYGMLGVTGLEIAVTGDKGGSGDGGTTSPEGIADLAFEIPGGRFLVAAIGVGTLVVGVYHVQKGWQTEFLEDIDTEGLSERRQRLLGGLGLVGFTARALMLGIAGVLFLVAAWQFDSDEAAGLDQSLKTLAEVTPGRIAIGAASLGLVGAGIYDMVTFRRQRLSD